MVGENPVQHARCRQAGLDSGRRRHLQRRQPQQERTQVAGKKPGRGSARPRAPRDHFFDPFEYLAERHKDNLLKTDFKQSLGKIAWQVACHQRVQKIGPKTRDILQLIPDTEVVTIERCSGHDGTYGVKHKTYDNSRKIVRPVERRVREAEAQHFTSDCPLAGGHIAHGLNDQPQQAHPISLLRKAYGL